MEQVNSWIKGINADASYLAIDNNSYLSLEGGLVLTEAGQSTGAIETERGTLPLFELPAVPKIYKLTLLNNDNTGNTNITIEFVDQFIFVIDTTNLTTTRELFDALINDSNVSGLIDLGFIKVDFSLEYGNISIWAKDTDTSVNLQVNNPSIFVEEINSVRDPVIIGSGIYQDSLILATCSKDNIIDTPNGQIWRFKIDPVTNQVVTNDGLLPAGDELIPFEHLIYSERLNFDTAHYMTKIICNPETTSVGRIYWNDKKNPIGSLNILADFPMNTPLELVSGAGQSLFGEIVPRKIINGGFITTGSVVQYYYRLRSSSGGTTSPVSIGSNLIKLTQYNSTSPNDDGVYEGSEPLAAENESEQNLFKSIELELQELDTNYQFVELIYVLYTEKDVPQTYIVAELPIPQSGTLTYIHDGNPENFVTLPPAEINGRVNNITKANDIAVKDARLLAFGVELAEAELEFDTRMYRFKNNFGEITAKLIDEDFPEPIILTSSNPDWDSVPLEHDAINPYNDDSDEQDWYNNNQYKYQANGTTLGAEGKNLKMRFTTLKLTGDVNDTETRNIPPHLDSGRFPDGTIIDFGNDITYDLSGEYQDFRSPKIDSFAKGYAREEVYRVFMNFADKQGNPFYASWVCDVKMPYEWDFDTSLEQNDGTTEFFDNQNNKFFIPGMRVSGGVVELYSLGMEFEVKNLDQIQDKISGFWFSIVKRTDENKTKVDHGIITPTYAVRQGGSQDEINYADPPRSSSRLHLTTPAYSHGNDVDGRSSLVTGTGDPFFQETRPISIFRSIDDYVADKAFKYTDGDYFTLGSVFNSAEANVTAGSNQPNVFVRKIFANRWEGVHWLTQSKYPLDDSLWNEIGTDYQQTDLNGLEFVSLPSNADFVYLMSSNYSNFTELSFPDNGAALGGVFRYPRHRILFHPSRRLSYNPVDPDGGELELNPASNNLYMTCSYKRNLDNQYGGNKFEARQSNIAHPVTPFIRVEKGDDAKTVKVFGGDTYVSYYAFWTVTREVTSRFGRQANYASCNFINFAVTESTLNPFYSTGIQWFLSEKTPSQFLDDDGNMDEKDPLAYNINNFFNYNNVYRQQNDLKVSVPKPSLTRDNNIFPAGIFISDRKINGDRVDAWKNFRLDNYKEVDNPYGPIIFGDNFNDRLIFIQERAIGIQAINERALAFNDETGTQIVLGNGELLGEHGYISTRSGTIHNKSVLQSEFGLYYFDAYQNKIKQLDLESNKPLSDMFNIYSKLRTELGNKPLLRTDNPLNDVGVVGGIDYQAGRVFMTFLSDTPFSLCINEKMGAVEYYPNVHPRFYVQDHNNLIMPHNGSLSELGSNASLIQRGVYNNYLGVVAPLKLSFVVNQPAELQKVLTNLLWKSELYDPNGNDNPNETISTIRVFNNYQDTGEISANNFARVMRQWGYKVLFNVNSERPDERMRNEWFVVEITYNNIRGNRFVLHNIISKVMPSHSGLGPY